jgi:gluconate 5-dehydrogenase
VAVVINLNGHRALITGASRGIGRAIALSLSAAGAEVVLVARREDALNTVRDEIVAKGGKAYACPFDISDISAIHEFFDKVAEDTGPIDILVNDAGVNLRAPAADMDIDTWHKVLKLNLDAVFFLSQAFFRKLRTDNLPGRIVNIASLLSEAARPGIAPYTASKGAIRQLTKALAVEWAPFKVTVNAVGPGYIATEMTDPLQKNPDFNQWVLERTPLKRWGEPDDVASAVLFLVSDLARFVTGQILYVDGGWLANL